MYVYMHIFFPTTKDNRRNLNVEISSKVGSEISCLTLNKLELSILNSLRNERTVISPQGVVDRESHIPSSNAKMRRVAHTALVLGWPGKNSRMGVGGRAH